MSDGKITTAWDNHDDLCITSNEELHATQSGNRSGFPPGSMRKQRMKEHKKDCAFNPATMNEKMESNDIEPILRRMNH